MNFEPYTGKFPDFKESFDLGSAESQTLPDNWIPDEDLPGYQTYATNFYNTCREFQLFILLPTLALGLDLPKDFFLGYHEANENQLRLLHYPGAPTGVFESGERGKIGAHMDFGTGTLLFQDDCGGLEVETPSQPVVLMHVPPVPGTVLFNIGDFLMRWSNDTLYRVRAPSGRDDQGDDGETEERLFPMAYFLGADKEKAIECLPGCSGLDGKFVYVVSGLVNLPLSLSCCIVISFYLLFVRKGRYEGGKREIKD